MATDIIRGRGEYRKDFYKIFEGIVGRQMTEREHAFLKAMMQNYLNDCEPTVVKQAPVEHKYICTNCAGEKIGVGTGFNMKMKKEARRNKKNCV